MDSQDNVLYIASPKFLSYQSPLFVLIKGRSMNQRSLFIIFLVATVLTFTYFIYTNPRAADIIFTNANVYTLDPESPVVEAVAVHGGRIVGTGNTRDLLREFDTKQVIDLTGKTMVPGFIDAHAHMNGLGELMQSIVLVGVTSPEGVAALVRERAKRLSPGEWIYGRGWDQNLWPTKQFPTKAWLDAAAPNNPIILGRIDGHAIWVNGKAMEIAKISRETKDPEGGKIVRDIGGSPTGIFIDNAKSLIENVFPPQSPEEIERSLLIAARECVKMGLTEVHDMGDSAEVEIYKQLADHKNLPIRIYAVIGTETEGWRDLLDKGPIIGYSNGMFTLRAVKFYMDGALGSRGAALFDEYADDPGNRGITRMSKDSLETAVRVAINRGFQPCTHAIGDRANRIVLDAYETLLKSLPKGDYRLRIEHAQVLSPNDIPRFEQLGVLPSMQPIHATSDMYWAEARLGPERVKGAYAWRSLLETATIILGGSDFPNDTMNPLWGFYAAISRGDPTGYPAEGWYGKQKMTREEALKSITLWAAYGAFQEPMKGSIEIGKYADLTILSKDIMTIPAREILKTDVEMTVVGGKVVYVKEATQQVP